MPLAVATPPRAVDASRAAAIPAAASANARSQNIGRKSAARAPRKSEPAVVAASRSAKSAKRPFRTVACCAPASTARVIWSARLASLAVTRPAASLSAVVDVTAVVAMPLPLVVAKPPVAATKLPEKSSRLLYATDCSQR